MRAASAPVETAVEIGRDWIIAVASPDYRLRREGTNIEGATLLGGPWSRTTWAAWSELADAPRFVAPQLVAAPSETAAIEAARLGLGVALARSNEVATAVDQRALVVVFPAKLAASDRYWAIARGRNASTSFVFDWMTRRFAHHGDDGAATAAL